MRQREGSAILERATEIRKAIAAEVFNALRPGNLDARARQVDGVHGEGVQATFDWQAARDSVVGRMCTATLVNDVETY